MRPTLLIAVVLVLTLVGVVVTTRQAPAHTLVRTTPTSTCADGLWLEAGLDSNGDGRLQNEEVNPRASVLLCATHDGVRVASAPAGTRGLTMLVRVDAEPRGETCAKGGKRVTRGLDENANGVLDAAEVDASATLSLCNDETNALVAVTNEGACRVVSIGHDVDGNGRLAVSEVSLTQRACDTEADERRLLRVDHMPDTHCAMVFAGYDGDGDGALQLREVTGPATAICLSAAAIARR